MAIILHVINMLYDIIVVGSGCAGLAGAMYAGRLGMKTLHKRL